MSESVLHIHAGLAAMMLARLVTRRSLGSYVPIGVVFAAEAFNEIMDYLAYGPRWQETLVDVANTLFWPAVIFLGVRLRPMIGGRRHR